MTTEATTPAQNPAAAVEADIARGPAPVVEGTFSLEDLIDDSSLALLSPAEQVQIREMMEADKAQTPEPEAAAHDTPAAADVAAQEQAAAQQAPAPTAPAQAPAPVETAALADLKAKLAEVQKAEDALMDKYDDGEMTREAYKAAIADTRAQSAPLLAQIAAAEAAQAQVLQSFEQEATGFIVAQAIPESVLPLFDQTIAQLEQTQAGRAMSNRQLLEAAYIAVVPAMQAAGLSVKPLAQGAQQPQQQKPQQRALPPNNDGLGTVPPTLNALPPAMAGGAGTSAFSGIDQRISEAAATANPNAVYAAEKALSSMTQDELDAFLMSA